MNLLITIPFSHFCEKARWALDWCGVPYVERACLPVLHLRHTRRIGGRTVPALIRGDGGALVDSTDILEWADAQAPAGRKLFPSEARARAAAKELEDDFDTRLGPETRRWAYAHGLRHRAMLRAMVAPSFPRARDRLLLALLLPAVGPLIAKHYAATLENAARGEGIIVEAFDAVSRRLEAQPYLAGDRFGAADLTFAALGGVMVRPPEHRWLSATVEVKPEMRALIERLAATRAGQHALRCYREHRAPATAARA